MSDRPPLLYCQDILESGSAILSYVQDISFDVFEHDRMRYSAVIREFEIVGEAVGKLPKVSKDGYPDIPWQDIKDFRNLLAHEYFGVDLEIVWNTIHNELPILIDAVQKIQMEALKAQG
jgi:uncharacterized protein with HEPN domain